jgi:hypothetical protein
MSRRRPVDPRQLALPLYWAPDPTPYELYVAHVVQDLCRRSGGPVPATVVAGHLGKADRTARLYLRRLERARVAMRPKGPRSGWMVMRGMVQ